MKLDFDRSVSPIQLILEAAAGLWKVLFVIEFFGCCLSLRLTSPDIWDGVVGGCGRKPDQHWMTVSSQLNGWYLWRIVHAETFGVYVIVSALLRKQSSAFRWAFVIESSALFSGICHQLVCRDQSVYYIWIAYSFVRSKEEGFQNLTDGIQRSAYTCHCVVIGDKQLR